MFGRELFAISSIRLAGELNTKCPSDLGPAKFTNSRVLFDKSTQYVDPFGDVFWHMCIAVQVLAIRKSNAKMKIALHQSCELLPRWLVGRSLMKSKQAPSTSRRNKIQTVSLLNTLYAQR